MIDDNQVSLIIPLDAVNDADELHVGRISTLGIKRRGKRLLNADHFHWLYVSEEGLDKTATICKQTFFSRALLVSNWDLVITNVPDEMIFYEILEE